MINGRGWVVIVINFINKTSNKEWMDPVGSFSVWFTTVEKNNEAGILY